MQTDLFIQVGLAVVAAFIICFASTPIVKSFAQRVGAIDVPKDGRRMHDHPIPRLGGLAIFLGFLLSVVLFADISKAVQGILLGSVVIVIVGVIDDIVPLPAWLKFIVQIFAALIAVYHGVVIDHLTNPNIWSSADYLNLGWLSIPITVLWIVAITNSVNLIDGLDGLAAGVSAISSFTMMIICHWSEVFSAPAEVSSGLTTQSLSPSYQIYRLPPEIMTFFLTPLLSIFIAVASPITDADMSYRKFVSPE